MSSSRDSHARRRAARERARVSLFEGEGIPERAGAPRSTAREALFEQGLERFRASISPVDDRTESQRLLDGLLQIRDEIAALQASEHEVLVELARLADAESGRFDAGASGDAGNDGGPHRPPPPEPRT